MSAPTQPIPAPKAVLPPSLSPQGADLPVLGHRPAARGPSRKPTSGKAVPWRLLTEEQREGARARVRRWWATHKAEVNAARRVKTPCPACPTCGKKWRAAKAKAGGVVLDALIWLAFGGLCAWVMFGWLAGD